jgi:TetR/AcrR family transcriptional repressor of mexJK operon
MEEREVGRSARKHRAIVEAATTAFLDKGYDGTSMDEIAAIAAVSKQTVYKHFADKETLFAEIVLATTEQVNQIVRLVTDSLADSQDLAEDLGELARRFITVLMQPQILRLRRMVISSANRFPDLGRTWYEQGFERALAAMASAFQELVHQGLLFMDDPQLAADHFVGMLLWIPVNKAMFTGNDNYGNKVELEAYADATVRVFLNAYGRP